MVEPGESRAGHWLDRYATAYHRWEKVSADPRNERFARPLGLVETFFHHDGSDFEGRADVNMTPTCYIETSLSADQIRIHILETWAALRAKHPLLRARVENANDNAELANSGLVDKCFVVDVPDNGDALLCEAHRTIVFMGDYYAEIDSELFLRHAMNTARCINPSTELARLFILPLERQGTNNFILRTLLVCAHQILDGATIFAWTSQFVRLLNTDDATLHAAYAKPDAHQMWASLPPAQEDLYPRINGSQARQRWFWAISRVLRHCQRPLPSPFANPLRRDEPLPFARAEPPMFDKVLNYSIVPPLNSYTARFELSSSVTKTLHRLCREAKASIGAGGFALVAATMMELYEERFPDIPLSDRRGFTATFPVNPRPFLNYRASPDSLMLAFSNGIFFPFLPSYLPIERRFKMLVRCAHRQLRIYQKRPRSSEMEAQLGSRSVTQMIPSLYTSFVERTERFRPEGQSRFSPQGAYPVNQGGNGATCGVSSVGAVGKLLQDDSNRSDASTTFQVVDLTSMGAVRVRDDEFLCGIVSEPDRFSISVAFDGNAIDEERIAHWIEKMRHLLSPQSSSSSKL